MPCHLHSVDAILFNVALESAESCDALGTVIVVPANWTLGVLRNLRGQ